MSEYDHLQLPILLIFVKSIYMVAHPKMKSSETISYMLRGGSVHDIEAMKLENNYFPPVTTMDALSCLLLPTLRFRNFYIKWRQACRD